MLEPLGKGQQSHIQDGQKAHGILILLGSVGIELTRKIGSIAHMQADLYFNTNLNEEQAVLAERCGSSLRQGFVKALFKAW